MIAKAFLPLLAVVMTGCAGNAPISSCSTQPKKTSLRVTSISPWVGYRVGQDTVISAELEYSIADFSQNEYFVIAQVDNKDGVSTSDGTYPSDRYPLLLEPCGHIHYSFPLAYVWSKESIAHPISIRFLLNRGDLRESEIVVTTKPFKYEERLKK